MSFAPQPVKTFPARWKCKEAVHSLWKSEPPRPGRDTWQQGPGDAAPRAGSRTSNDIPFAVAEATDANGQLFGFERVNELLRKAKTAAEIAGAAQAFGQEDDISVISVTRTAVREPAAA